MLPPATREASRAERARVRAALIAIRREWDSHRTPQQAQDALPRLTALLSAAMVGAASDGAASVGPALEQAGFPVEPDATPAPAAFGRSASDGRPLLSLLAGAVLRSQGSMTQGRQWLDVAVHTQVADAARGGAAVAITARPKVGWVRMVSPPCCKDCAVQAGRWFRWNQGFPRHPNCDCIHRPAHQDEPPDGYAQAVENEQITGLTVAERAALDNGGELGRVVNAARGRSADRMTTSELSRRGRARLTPEAIHRVSTTREEAVRRLRKNGYLLP